MMELKSHDKWSKRANGTSFSGYLKISYRDLTTILGKPRVGTDEYKTDAEWHVSIFMNGEDAGFVTIYNYKDGKNYQGANGLNVEDITNWHVGSKTKWDYYNLTDAIDSELEHIETV